MRTLFVEIRCDKNDCTESELIEHTRLADFYKISGWEQRRDGLKCLDVCKKCALKQGGE